MMAIMLAAGQVAIAFLAIVSGMGFVGAAAMVANALLLMVAMTAAKRWPMSRRWMLLGWAVTAIAATLLLQGFGDRACYRAYRPTCGVAFC